MTWCSEESDLLPVDRPTENTDAEQSAWLPIGSLLPADSPRLGGEDVDHIQTLANVDGPLPPILVNRTTARVVDGMHRIGAARLRGEATIEAVFYDGDEADEFVESVRRNVRQGKPLTGGDRAAAAVRITATHPVWSDRRIAALTGLSPTTVAELRQRSSVQSGQLNTRIGRDGRSRPVSAAEGRKRASRYLADNPQATLRQVAAASGVALATAKDVRDRIRRGEDPLPAGQRRQSGASGDPAPDALDELAPAAPPPDMRPLLQRLVRDPALRFNEQGRNLLRALSLQADLVLNHDNIADMLPAHCRSMVAQAAMQCSAAWLALAESMEAIGDEAH
ncbi:hypothetical protein ACWDFR_42755 [Streptomyces sp. 900105755]